jgi:uncharacterized protein YciI
MKHFLVELQYTAPLDYIDAALPDHRAFLQRGYDEGYLLMSGPKEPRTGGVIIARSESLETLQAYLDQDPFQQLKLAHYTYKEFAPVKYLPVLDGWISGK